MKACKILIAGLFFLFLSLGIVAQPPPPPDGHGQTGDQGPGGGASSGSGIVLFVLFTAAYAAKKVYGLNKKKELISE